jgi:hypothetical protein
MVQSSGASVTAGRKLSRSPYAAALQTSGKPHEEGHSSLASGPLLDDDPERLIPPAQKRGSFCCFHVVYFWECSPRL